MTARREISRREFLKTTGRAAAGAAVGSTLLLATASGHRETALITDFGARGNGRHDDTEAILKAIDEIYDAGGGIVKVPATEAFYKTTRAIDIRSDVHHPVHIVGEGEKSFIKNTATNAGHEFAPVFRPGLLVAGTSERSAPGQDYYAIAPAEKGAESIKPRGGRFKAGDMLLIAGGERQYHGDRRENWYPTFPQITLVEGVDNEGVKLADPLLDDQPDASVAVYKYGVSHGSIKNLRFEQENLDNLGFGAIAGGGAYKMVFRRLTMSRGVSVAVVNGFAYCELDDIKGAVAKKGLEFARYSHSTIVRNVGLRGLRERAEVSLILFAAEATHRMTFANCNVDVRGKAPATKPDALGQLYGIGGFLGGTRYNLMRYCTLTADKHSQGFSIVGAGDKPSLGNRIADCEITADGAEWVIRVASGGEGAGGHVVTHNRADGDGAQGSILLGGYSSDCKVTRNIAPQGVKDFGSNNTVEGNAKEDAAGVGPR